MAQQPQMATVDDLAISLRHSMLGAAQVGLAGLDKLIADDGYDWLDSYMSSIMDTQTRAPIAELIKTPSRTGGATAKKTRAAQAAMTARAEKIKGLNARLGITPKKSGETRSALSPLQSRDVNVFLATPSSGRSHVNIKSPLGPKAHTAKPKQAKAKPKKEVGRIDAPIVVDAEAPPAEVAAHVETPVVEVQSSEPEKVEERQRPAELSVSPEPEAEPVAQVAATDIAEQPMPLSVPAAEEKTSAVVTEATSAAIELAASSPKAVSEAEEEEELELEADLSLEVEEDEEAEEEQQTEATEPEEAQEVASASTGLAEPVSVNAEVVDLLVPLKDVDDEPQNTGSQTQLAKSTSTPNPIAPPRNVRSSWLSKALTAGESSGQRKSYAPGVHAALMGQSGDFGGLRKSLVPVGGLSLKEAPVASIAGSKRDSTDAALDHDKTGETVRPDKITRIVHPSLQAEQPTFPLARSVASATSLPQPGIAPTNPVDLSKSVSLADRPRSDIHKVTKALEDMREKAAAKARITAAASTLTKPTATSTGTGFLRGLSNLGMSLGMSLSGRANEPLDAAAIAAAEAAEAEADARATAEAEAELAALMAQAAPKSVKKPVETEPEAAETPLVESPAIVSQPSFDQFFGTFALDHPADERYADQPVLMDQPSVSPPHSAEMVDLGAESEEEMEPEQEEEVEEEQAKQPDESTTPVNSPPRPAQQAMPVEKPQQERPPIFKLMPSIQKPEATTKEPVEESRPNRKPSAPVDLMEMEDELPELVEYPVENATKLSQPKMSGASDRTSVPAFSVPGSLNSSVASTVAMLNQSQASMIAGKVLGQKPATGSVKSVQAASTAAKKDQALRDRKNAQREAAEQRKQQAAQRKAEEEKRAAEEERKAKLAEQEARAKAKLEAERRRKEREERAAIIAKQKAAREKREAAAAAELAEAERIKKAEEASRKRKMAPILSKSTTNPAAKRQAQGPQSSLATSVKGKEPVRPIAAKPAGPLAKMGPSGFKPAPTVAPSAPPATFVATQTTTSTISLVQQPQPDRRPLGPPSRPSHQPQSHTTPLGPGRASSVLQQSRTVLQAQLDQQAIAIQAQVDAVELPDIASEYSDSDDEERQETFQRPQWAESPELRSALERQAHFNPDELFGPIKPLSMEELFKVRQGKFRSRTSSANWSGADRLTRTEEIEYAKRMGFAPLGQQLFRQSDAPGRPSGSGGGEER